MTNDRYEYPDDVIIDGYLLADICWLLTCVEEFARFGDTEAVSELVRFVDRGLCADGLADIAGGFASRARRRIEAAS